MISSSAKEYKSFINYKYGYSYKSIVLKGLSRFDNLKNLQKEIQKEKIILIFPTWRMYIKGIRDLITHESIPSESFLNTTYFHFYKDLISN